jgi:hypothetical protein
VAGLEGFQCRSVEISGYGIADNKRELLKCGGSRYVLILLDTFRWCIVRFSKIKGIRK